MQRTRLNFPKSWTTIMVDKMWDTFFNNDSNSRTPNVISRVMKKICFLHMRNQLRGERADDRRLCFRYLVPEMGPITF